LFNNFEKKKIPIEAVYIAIEMKTDLSKRDYDDAIEKFLAIRRLKRAFADGYLFDSQRHNVLCAIVTSKSPHIEQIRTRIHESYKHTQFIPDFVICPGSYVITGGTYHRVAHYGAEGSAYRREMEARGITAKPSSYMIDNAGEDSLYIWIAWLHSWLHMMGPRAPDLAKYSTLIRTPILGDALSE